MALTGLNLYNSLKNLKFLTLHSIISFQTEKVILHGLQRTTRKQIWIFMVTNKIFSFINMYTYYMKVMKIFCTAKTIFGLICIIQFYFYYKTQ